MSDETYDTNAEDDKMNDSLNTPGQKKPPIQIKILENRRIAAGTSGAAAATTTSAVTSLNFATKTLNTPKVTTTTTTTPTTTATTKQITQLQTSAIKTQTTNVTSTANAMQVVTTSSTPLLQNAKNITKTAVVSSFGVNTPPKVLPVISGGARVVSVAKGAQSFANATLTTIDGKTVVRTADGRILYLKTTPGAGGTTAVAKSIPTLSGNKSMTTVNTTGGLASGSTLISKPLGGTTQTKVVTALKSPTVVAAAKSTVLPIKAQSAQTPTAIQAIKSNAVVSPQKTVAVAAKPTTTTTATAIKPLTATVATPGTANVANKSISVQVVRTADGKLVKVNPKSAITTSLASATQATAAASSNTTAAIQKETGTKSGNAGITLTPNMLLGKKVITTAAGGQFILKTPITKNVNLTKASSIAQNATATTTTPTTTTSIKAITSTAPKATNIIQKVTTTSAGAATTPKILNSSLGGTQSSLKSQQVTLTTTPTNKVVMTSSSNSNNNSNISSSSSNYGKSNVATGLMANQPYIKLSPKADGNIAAAVASGQLKTVQFQGKSGIQYVRVLPANASAPSAPTAISGGATKGNLITVNKSLGSANKVTTTFAATKIVATTTAPTITSSTLSTSTAAATAATNASNIKILNTLPQKFTIVRGTQAQTTTTTTSKGINSASSSGSASAVLTSATSTTTATTATVGGTGGLLSKSTPTHKFVFKRSPNNDGKSMPFLAVAQKKPATIINMKNYGRVTNVYPLDSNAARKHKISDMNMEIKRITTTSSAERIANKDNNSSSSIDESSAPDAKRPRYVFIPRTAAQAGKAGTAASTSTAGTVKIERNGTTSSNTASGSGNFSVQRVTVQSAGNSAGGGASSSATNTKTLSLLRTTPNGSTGRTTYVLLDAAQQQQRQKNSISLSNNNSSSSSNNLQRQVSETQRVASNDITSGETKIRKLPMQVGSTTSAASSRTSSISSSQQNQQQQQQQQQKIVHINSEKQKQQQDQADSENQNNKSGAANAKNPLKATFDHLKAPTAPTAATTNAVFDGLGASRRKHCNCSKSQCLKLYCDCFANGEFCQDCTCKDCFNNLQYEDERQRAIKSCLDRNPSAFKPKITARQHSEMRLHNKGCNCKRSGCLKNYCECFEAKIPCSSICKCIGCRNMEDRPDVDMDTLEAQGLKVAKDEIKKDADGNVIGGDNTNNIITDDVIDATIMCMVSQVSECEKHNLSPLDAEKNVMEELGRCLVEILDFSIRNADSMLMEESLKV